ARGFTLIEMLLVVAIISLLIAILLPVLTRTKELTRISLCASNQHQVHTAISAYSANNSRRFPYDTDTNNGVWMWDVTRDATTHLIESAGGKVDIFFCPSNPEQNASAYWNFSDYRVLGYFFLFQRASGPMATFPLTGGKQFVRSFSERYDHATQELITDATLANGDDFTRIQGGLLHRSPHLDGKTSKPTGGNILFLDGHVSWRPFSEMALRFWGPNHWY
ncbi:MAG: prepilin-type N-terminal cleavage/methylation domain-containing protein, partial [Pyrinomonadaceae bacterium]|nr:prepilin-type N-terminal cleavage/methylation domain-containing protein [Phycisphaerales bacterium]